MTYGIDNVALTLPITRQAIQTALAFAQQQPTATKADQVRLNTLAVLAVRDYFELMEIPTDVAASDSWDPVMRVCMDVADLELPEVGRLECRPMLPGGDRCVVPAETWDDRVGYVMVQVDEAAQEAKILGFVPTLAEEDVALSQLRSPEALLDHLYNLRHPQRVLTNLGNWLQTAIQEGIEAIADGWQAVEQVLVVPEYRSAYAFRQRGMAVRRARRLNLGATAVALIVDVRVETADQTDIRLQVHPVDAATRLPSGLTMAVLEASGELVVDAQAIGTEDFLELQIDGVTGDAFRVEIGLNSLQETYDFVI